MSFEILFPFGLWVFGPGWLLAARPQSAGVKASLFLSKCKMKVAVGLRPALRPPARTLIFLKPAFRNCHAERRVEHAARRPSCVVGPRGAPELEQMSRSCSWDYPPRPEGDSEGAPRCQMLQVINHTRNTNTNNTRNVNETKIQAATRRKERRAALGLALACVPVGDCT